MSQEIRPAAEEAAIRELLAQKPRVAVVGISADPLRPSHDVAKYMRDQGYPIVPINPSLPEVLGEKAYPDLASLPEPVAVVDVFRRSEFVPEIARQAVAAGARLLWLQEGVRHDQAAAWARERGLLVVQDRCLKKVHRRLFGHEL